MKRQQVRRVAWFAVGARATANSCTPIEAALPFYICPLCCRVFLQLAAETGELTFEHVPPRSLGGRELVLTCSTCNGSAGTRLDHEMLTYEQALDFGQGTLSRPVRVTLRVGEYTLNSEMIAANGSIEIKGISAANHPDAPTQLSSELEKRIVENTWDESRFSVTLDKGYHSRKVEVGWLRVAYLIAFAALGYQYILHPALRAVRLQVADPDTLHLASFSTTVPQSSPENRRILLIEEPETIPSILVQIGRHAVFLPWIETDVDLYSHLARENEKATHLHLELRGKEIPWPRRAEYALDLVPQKRRYRLSTES